MKVVGHLPVELADCVLYRTAFRLLGDAVARGEVVSVTAAGIERVAAISAQVDRMAASACDPVAAPSSDVWGPR